uniref:5-hydroxytryptamine receptor 2A n=1 Tax=Ailuropoda melanoleuca TaxID=9646 RepID=A0A7N5JAZ9_AILME
MDILFEENASLSSTTNSLMQLHEDPRLYIQDFNSGEANTSDAFNWTVDSENRTNLSCEGCLSPPCFSLLHLQEKNWSALLTAVVIILTIAGNILVIMAVSLEKKLQNATNYFLMSLAIADMLLGFLVMPVSMLTILYGYRWPLPSKLCAVWIYLDVLFSTASIMHLCAISLDRYVAIQNPIHHSRFNSRTKAFLKIIAVWTISVVVEGREDNCLFSNPIHQWLSSLKQDRNGNRPGISMPIPVFGLQDDSKVFKEGSCLLADDNFVLIGSFVSFFIPLTIMVITYFLTIKSLQKEATLCVSDLSTRAKLSSFSFLPQSSLSSEKLFQRSIHREPGSYGRRTMQSISNEQKACKVLGIVFFLFVVMWCPFFITNIMAVICKESCNEDIIGALLNVFVWIGYLSSAVNPLVYTLFNKTYRSAFSRYIQCQYKENKKPLQLILVNTIPALAYKSSQLQMGQKKNSKKDAKSTDTDYSMVALGTQHSEDAPTDNINTVNEKVSCV